MHILREKLPLYHFITIKKDSQIFFFFSQFERLRNVGLSRFNAESDPFLLSSSIARFSFSQQTKWFNRMTGSGCSPWRCIHAAVNVVLGQHPRGKIDSWHPVPGQLNARNVALYFFFLSKNLTRLHESFLRIHKNYSIEVEKIVSKMNNEMRGKNSFNKIM